MQYLVDVSAALQVRLDEEVARTNSAVPRGETATAASMIQARIDVWLGALDRVAQQVTAADVAQKYLTLSPEQRTAVDAILVQK